MPEQRSPDVIQVNLRLTRDLHKRLVREAKKTKRSLNLEMVWRLNRSFDREHADEILAIAKETLDSATALNDLVIEKAKELGRLKLEIAMQKGAKK